MVDRTFFAKKIFFSLETCLHENKNIDKNKTDQDQKKSRISKNFKSIRLVENGNFF